MHDTFLHLVQQLRDAYAGGHAEKVRGIQGLLDRKVYELYSLTESEIRLVEEATA